MKIGVITFHQALNYGAILQAYAFQKFVDENFTDVEIELIDYRCPYFSQLYSVNNQKGNNFAKRILKKTHFMIKRKLFSSFIKKHIALSDTYTENTIKNANDRYNKFIVGSDQVWNPNLTNHDKNYLLTFTDVNKRYSYAASIGLAEIPQYVSNDYLCELGRFSKISVRENQAIKTIHKLGVTSVSVEQHIDPTLLLTRSEWDMVCVQKKEIKKKDFVLIFTVDYSKELIDEVVCFARKKQLDVYYVGQRTKNPNVKYIPLISIEKLLALFSSAKYVFVNSFHGTIFSIIYHKQFYVRLAHTDGRNSRIINLLEKVSLTNKTSVEFIDTTIDWGYVEQVIDSERQRSMEYIAEIINDES
ncbi:polysaccharide pyruvyl transferase family protein [Sedimentibacter saalensis]|uniref:Polysaccharide pyruvyl transferase n=1 Tax=Sedimentibacter saalensis TaxID=130788 RepID=A0A562J8B9_9FIRM|nr:polysaccharide pyruvyl transferase family protein [Sedimentibacter saalensis]TWH79377.1 polysaccharide pyruvyl transferase [Sedimentibacter saalensis]